MKKIKGKHLKEAGAAVSQRVIKLKPGKPRVRRSRLTAAKVYFEKVKVFLEEVVSELKLVIWPNRKETLATTGVVLILVIILAIYLGLVDYGLSHLVGRFIH